MKKPLLITVIALSCLALIGVSSAAASSDVFSRPRIEADLAAVNHLRAGLQNTLKYIAATPEVFQSENRRELPGRDEKVKPCAAEPFRSFTGPFWASTDMPWNF